MNRINYNPFDIFHSTSESHASDSHTMQLTQCNFRCVPERFSHFPYSL